MYFILVFTTHTDIICIQYHTYSVTVLGAQDTVTFHIISVWCPLDI